MQHHSETLYLFPSLFLAFQSHDWGMPGTSNWIGPEYYNITENIPDLPTMCQFKAFREHEQNLSSLTNTTG